MSSNANDSGDWLPCPPGLLRERGLQARSVRQRQTVVKAVGASLLVILVGIGAWSILGQLTDREKHFGGIACFEVRANMPGFMAGTLAEDVAARMRVHLDQCPDCQELMRNMPKMQAASGFAGSADPEDCQCEACRRDRLLANRGRVDLQASRLSLAVLASAEK